MRRWLLILLGIGMALAIASCQADSFRQQQAQVPQLVISTISDPKSFNYAIGDGFPNTFLFTTEGLLAEDGDGVIKPNLAESWQVSPDRKKLTFKLRPGLKWSDGAPLTAEDIVFTYNDIYLNEAIPTDFRDVLRVGTKGLLPSVRKLDDLTVEFTVPEPFAPFLRTAGGLGFLPAHVLRDTVRTKGKDGNPRFLSTWGTDTDPKKVVGNGPYIIESYIPSQRIVFRRNPYYWQKDPDGKPMPYIERIIWKIVESSDTEILKFRSGDLDILGGLGTVRAEDFSLLKREEARGKFQIQFGGPRSSTLHISFNQNKGQRNGKPLVDPIKSRWFNTKEFRQAVAYALDRQKMVDNTFRGLAEKQDSPISVHSPYYLTPAKGLKTYDYNPEKARELLKQAGFRYDAQGRLEDSEGHRVRFTLITNAENRTRVALGAQIKQDLAAIGMQVDFNPIAFNTLLDKLDNSLDWECHLLGFTGGVEPNNGFNIWNPEGGSHTFNQQPRAGSQPIVGREVAPWERRIGDLYVQAAQELDEAKRQALYAETQQLSQEYLPFIHLANQLSMAAVRDRVQGVRYTALGLSIWNLPEQKIIEAKK